MSSKKFYLDLHIHTARYSPCSTIAPEQLIAKAKARRLDGLALTEHERRWTREEVEALKAQSGDGDFIILVGTEVRTVSEERFTGDLLVFGPVSLSSQPSSIDEVCRQAHRQGGIVIAPHPFAGCQGIGEALPDSAVDGLEVYNYRYRPPGGDQLAEWICRQAGLAALASSDAHALADVGRYCTEFDDPVRSEAELIEAVLARRCRPRHAYPPRLFGRFF